MTTETLSITPGEIYIDSNTGDEVFVLGESEQQADEYVATYGYNKEPLYVSDLSECADDATIIEVVYPSQIERLGANLNLDEVEQLISQKKVKIYGFPRQRLEQKD